MMNKKIKEVNGIKVLRRYSAGSIFSGLVCLVIVAVMVIGLLAPWLTFTISDDPDNIRTTSVGVIKFFDFLFIPAEQLDADALIIKNFFAPPIGDIMFNIFYISILSLWVIAAVFASIILFLGLEFLFRGKVSHYKLAFKLSIWPTVCSALTSLLAIGAKVYMIFVNEDPTHVHDIGFIPTFIFVGILLVASIILGTIHHTCFRNRVFIGDLGDLKQESAAEEGKALGQTYTTKEVVKVRYEPSIGLPNKLSSIGGHAFSQNENLQIAMIPNGIKSLGQAAFANCPKLQIVSIPLSVKSIGYNCFFNCTELKRINYAGCKEQWRHIKRGSNWLTNAGTCTVVCCDGAIVVNPYH